MMRDMMGELESIYMHRMGLSSGKLHTGEDLTDLWAGLHERLLKEREVGLEGLNERLARLSPEDLVRLSRLPIQKVYDEVVGGTIVPNRETRRRLARQRGGNSCQ